MKRAIIVGAGPMGQVVEDIMRTMNEVEVLGFLDDNRELLGTTMDGIPVLGAIDELPSLSLDRSFSGVTVAIGDNARRRAIADAVATEGIGFISAVHRSTTVAPSATLGAGSMICPGVVVGVHAKVGAHSILNTSCSIDHHVVVGDFAHLAPGSHLGGNIEIGHGVFIGAGSAIVPSVRIGDWSVVGAGSVVTHDIPRGVLAYGNPARVIRVLEEPA